MAMEQRKLSSLVKDYTVYPRVEIDPSHVNHMVESLQLDRALPPIVACRKTLRIVDGYHRWTALAKYLGEEASVDVELRDYKNDGELFVDSIELNGGHGRKMTTYDRVRCLSRAKELRVSVDKIAHALRIGAERAKELLTDRTALTRPSAKNESGELVPLKNTIGHMAGRSMSKPQIEANDKLSGMSAKFTAHQLIILLENDLMPTDGELWESLQRLAALIQEHSPVAA